LKNNNTLKQMKRIWIFTSKILNLNSLNNSKISLPLILMLIPNIWDSNFVFKKIKILLTFKKFVIMNQLQKTYKLTMNPILSKKV
jgi:hypothetical protein